MKRLHVHVGVENLEASVAFYSTLFSAEPTLRKPDYARWMIEDPRVNFAISSGNHAENGIEHLGIQVETQDELAELCGRLGAAGRPVLEEGTTTCCYAKSEKSWTSDPDGIVWETFLTNGEAIIYGDSPSLAALSANAAETNCCAPALPAADAAPKCCG
jgi:catechol 2,3-dioxygenase-like lactoylglutathione lyase family enzyme